MADRLPPLLTVEEAARVLRIGRTKAYAMANEWRATDGRSGLPVVDFGHVLRVPLGKLEELVGAPLFATDDTARVAAPARSAVTAAVSPVPVTEPRTRPRNAR